MPCRGCSNWSGFGCETEGPCISECRNLVPRGAGAKSSGTLDLHEPTDPISGADRLGQERTRRHVLARARTRATYGHRRCHLFADEMRVLGGNDGGRLVHGDFGLLSSGHDYDVEIIREADELYCTKPATDLGFILRQFSDFCSV